MKSSTRYESSVKRAATAEEMLRFGQYRIYPFALCRLAGQPFTALSSLDSPLSLASGAELDRHEQETETRKRVLEEVLRQAIGTADDPKPRRRLIAAARNLRRHHKLSATQEEVLRGLGSTSLIQALDDWRSTGESRDEIARDLETVYEEERHHSRRALRVLAGDERFLAGLVLARGSLYDKFRRSLDTPFEKTPANRSQRRLELALLKFFTRSAAKTTPFSAFVSTVPTFWGSDATQELLELPADGAPRSAVALNKVLYGLLYRSCLKETAEIYRGLGVTVNPSLRRIAEGYEMLVAREGRERLVRFPALPAVELSVATIASRSGTMPFRELVDQLADDFGVEADEMGRRVDQMITNGLLQINSGVPDSEIHWGPLLENRLAGSDHPRAAVVRQLLARLESLRVAMATAGAEQRLTLLETTRQRIADALSALNPPDVRSTSGDGEQGGEPGQAFELQMWQRVKQNPLYEDTSLPGPARLSRQRLAPALGALARWTDWMRLLSLDWSAHANLHQHYERRYATDASVPFLAFFKSFYSEVYEAYTRYETGDSQKPFREVANPYGLTGFDTATRVTDRLCEVINHLWSATPDAENLHLGEAHFEAASREGKAELEELALSSPVSVAAFVHLLPESESFAKDSLLVDRQLIHPGMGKYFSRFLHQFDPQVTADLRSHNTRDPKYLVAELCDDSEFSFNANLHPPLADYEINYPANLTGLTPQTNLSLAGLDVAPDPDHVHRLKLIRRRTGQQVLPINPGFLTPLRRPPLFRVLELFSPVFHHRCLIPWHNPALNIAKAGPSSADSEALRVVYRPRVVFEERLVLSRRAWKVPAELLRQMSQGLSPARNFQSLNRWRRSHGMPRHVFFGPAPWDQQSAAPAKPGSKRSGGNDSEGNRSEGEPGPGTGQNPATDEPRRQGRFYANKPQYLSFASGLASQLLFDVAKDHQGYLIFEEMLPSPEMLAQRGGRGYATEIVLQLDREIDGCG